MKYFYSLFILFLMCIGAVAQPLPIMRNAMSTNVAGTPVLSRDDLSVTNVGGGTNWLFFGVVSQTVARLQDVWGSTGSVSLLAVTNVITGFGPNMFIIITNGVGTNTTFYATNYYGTNVFSPAASFVGGVIISNSVVTNQLVGGASNLFGLIIIGTNAGWFSDGGDGDINGDGHLTTLDITFMKNWISGAASSDTFLTNAEARARADIDGDGFIDLKDVQIARGQILGWTNIVDYRHQVQRIKSGTIGLTTNRQVVIGPLDLVRDLREAANAKLEIINTNRSFSDFMINTNEFVVSNHLTTANGSVDIYTNLAVRGSNYVAGQSYFGNTVYVDGPGSGLEVDAITITNATTNLGAFYIKDNAISNALLRCTNSTTGQATWDNNYLNATEVSNLVSSVAYGQTWFVWGSSNTLATNSAGTPYKAMLKGDTPLPATANTNTYTTPTAGQYVGEVITAIPAGISTIVPGDIVTESFAFLSENRTMVLQPEIYIRTNMIAPSFSALGEREVAVGPSFTVNNTFQSFAVNIPVTTNIVLSTTNYLVRKLRVVSVSGGTPNLLLVSQDGYPARVTFPIASSSFVLKSGDTMLGTLVLTNSYNVGNSFESRSTNANSQQFGSNTISGVGSIAVGVNAKSGTGSVQSNSIAIGFKTEATNESTIAIGYDVHVGGNFSVGIGDGVTSGYGTSGSNSVAIGESSSIQSDYGIAIGSEASVNGSSDNGIAIGKLSTAGGISSIAIGNSANASHSNAVAVGNSATTAANNEFLLGLNNNFVKIPGFLELPIGASLNYVWTCTNATTGRGQWKVGGGAGFSPSNAIPQTIFLLDGTNANIVPSGATHFNLTATNNFRLNIETNTAATDGQLITIRIIQDATGSRVCTTVTNWAFGTDITAITLTTTPNKTDYIKAVYNSGIGRWDVVGFVRGY